MKRNNLLLEKRRTYVINYLNSNQGKQIKVVVSELSESLFLTERTIYTIISKEVATITKKTNP
jgi:hypothetical protein